MREVTILCLNTNMMLINSISNTFEVTNDLETAEMCLEKMRSLLNQEQNEQQT
jgi:hypothetical protein